MRNDLKRLDAWDAPDQWQQIAQRTPGVLPHDRRGSRSRLAAGFVAFAVAVVGLGFGYLQLGGLDDEAPNPRGPVEIEHLVTNERTIDTGLRYPEGVVVGYGSVWVATRHANASSGDLLRLDPRTGDETARIPMPSLPGWEFGGAGIATGLGSVWVTGEGTESAAATAVFRIDPSSGSLAETIDVGPGNAADVWVDGNGIWVLTFPPRGQESMILYRVHPTTHEVADSTEVPAEWSQTVFAAGGWMYVLGSTGGTAPAETLFKIDPNTAEIVDRSRPTEGQEFSVTVSADRIWFFTDGLHALDGSTGEQVVGPLDGYSYVWVPSGLVADGSGGVWVTRGKARDGGGKTLLHLDRDGQVIASTGPSLDRDSDGIAAAYDPGSRSLWFVHYENTLLRLGLESQAQP